MGCNSSMPSVDDEEVLSRNGTPSATPPRAGLLVQRVHDVNHRSDTLQNGPSLVVKDKERFIGSPQQRMGPALVNRLGERGESIGSPSFRCYVKNDIQTDDTDVITAICEQRRATRRYSTSPLRNETASPLLSDQEGELKSHKRERGWMSKVLIKRGGDSGNTASQHQ